MKLIPWKMPSPEERRRNWANNRWVHTLSCAAFTMICVYFFVQGCLVQRKYDPHWSFFSRDTLLQAAAFLGLILETAWFAYYSWRAWHQIQAEERLRAEQARQSEPLPGVWPPPPRRE